MEDRTFVTDGDPLALDLERAIRHDDGAVAKAHLAAGFPVYFSDSATPAGCVSKLYPDGRRELVRFEGGIELRIQAAA
jgi:hypothetical protein